MRLVSNPSARARTAGNPSPTNPEGRVTKSRAESLIGHTVEKCVLAYHEILPQDSKYLYRVTTSQLREHLSFLASLNPPSKDETITPVITFDDGHRSNFEEAFPLLEQFGRASRWERCISYLESGKTDDCCGPSCGIAWVVPSAFNAVYRERSRRRAGPIETRIGEPLGNRNTGDFSSGRSMG